MCLAISWNTCRSVLHHSLNVNAVRQHILTYANISTHPSFIWLHTAEFTTIEATKNRTLWFDFTISAFLLLQVGLKHKWLTKRQVNDDQVYVTPFQINISVLLTWNSIRYFLLQTRRKNIVWYGKKLIMDDSESNMFNWKLCKLLMIWCIITPIISTSMF